MILQAKKILILSITHYIIKRLRQGGEKTVWKAERAWFLDRRKEESEAWNRASFV